MTGVTLRSVYKSFGAVHVIKDISLEIAPGELFFLLGPSGCGKTTLLRMIAGFSLPTSGSILFGNKEMSRVPPEQRNAGMVFQNYALWPHMSVAENVMFGLDVRNVPRDEKKRRVARALELVHLPGYEERYPHQLSGGQQQRVALARALVIEPDVVLLDEPLSNLDAGLRIEMRKEIHRIHQELGLTMIYVTHDQKEALSLATRLAVMYRGKLAQVAAPEHVYQHPDSLFVAKFIGETNVLQGRVTRVAGDELTLETNAGVLHCPAARAAMPCAAGDRVAVSVRPEGFEFARHGDASAALWPATIIESTYLGEIVQVVCRVREQLIRITALNPAGAPPRPGEDRLLRINTAHVRVLAPETTPESL